MVERFIFLEPTLYENRIMVLLSEYNFWAARQTDLEEWAKAYDCNISGMILSFPDLETYTLFKMRWA